MTDDPWTGMAQPSAANALNARRVDALLQWGFYWARGVDGRCMLLLRHELASSPATRLPHLKEIEVSLSGDEPDGSRLRVLRLVDASQRDLFYRLCLDIIEASAAAKSEAEAVALTLARTWRWHHLLRGGSNGLLSPEEQKGLIGELLVLERLLSLFPPGEAVAGWRGPLGAPKDFEVGRVWIEAKARRGAATPYVAVSSEFQLETEGADALFLHVADLDQAPSNVLSKFSLTDIAQRIRASIELSDQLAADRFDSLLAAAGFAWGDDYSESLWVRGADRIFLIADEFPRITPTSFATGVLNVHYAVSLPACEPFRVGEEVFTSALQGGQRAD